jgi:hypothetical protein
VLKLAFLLIDVLESNSNFLTAGHLKEKQSAPTMAPYDLRVPSPEKKDTIAKAFVRDLESFTVYDKATKCFRPVICCVCDSIPTEPNWSCYVPIPDAVLLFRNCKMEASHVEQQYRSEILLRQYSVDQEELKDFILSPVTYINDRKEILMCKRCHSALVGGKRAGRPPPQAIASGYIIGDAPVELTRLNEVEISIISRARIYCQSWIFFGGCHQHIKGWHTIFKNRPEDNVGNLMQLSDAGMHRIVQVVLCGPFTTTQRALTLASTAVNPERVLAAWHWLKVNNFRYSQDEIPMLEDIPTPVYLDENM